MGVPLFGVDISGIVKSATASGLPTATLRKPVFSAIDTADPTATPTVSYRSFQCRGFEDQSEKTRRSGTAIQQGAPVLVLLIGDTLPAGIQPEPGDQIQILGRTLEIVGEGVSNDPAKATYLCGCRS